MIELLNWRLWAALALAMGLAASHWKAYVTGKQVTQVQWDQQTLKTYEQNEKLRAENEITQAGLEADKEQLRKTKNAQIAQLNASLDDALDRLRIRPERPSDGNMPALTATGPACTGASLFKQDAEFLVRESNRADELRANLTECQAAYGKAREAVMK